jgi:hypothetical protein
MSSRLIEFLLQFIMKHQMQRQRSNAEERKKSELTSRSHRFSISFMRTTAATRRISTPNVADTALSGIPLTMTSFQIVSRASSDSTL